MSLARLSRLIFAAPLLRCFVLFALSCAIGGIGVLLEILPAKQQLSMVRDEIYQRQNVLHALKAQHSRGSTGNEANLQAWLAIFPQWRSANAEQDRLSSLVDLASKRQIQTLKLQAAPEESAPLTLLTRQEIRRLQQADVPIEIVQQGYRWQLQGSYLNLMLLLEDLTQKAASIDDLSIQRLDDKSQSASVSGFSTGNILNSPRDTADAFQSAREDQADVLFRADLAFRHFVRKGGNLPVPESSEPRPTAADFFKHPPTFDWQTTGLANSSVATGSIGRCSTSAAGYLNGVARQGAHIFADQQIEKIVLVGTVALREQSGIDGDQNQLRAVFRGDRGQLRAAEIGSVVAAQGYRLVSLSRRQATLEGPDRGAPNNQRVLGLPALYLTEMRGVEIRSATEQTP